MTPGRSSGRRRAVAAMALAVMIATAVSLGGPSLPPGGSHAPLLAGATIEPNVLAILTRSCADCHSEATRYPWYSRLAPISWLIRDDVIRGRARLNFSVWSAYSELRRQRYLSEVANQVMDREMPPSIYTLVHRGARLTGYETRSVFEWTQRERARMIQERANAARSSSELRRLGSRER